ncbi:MAG: hypothetical protein GKS00_18285 [Alphaproteobacteria bacterium]|nr:hypothetical protein [Alphaproteobacteria bacterium]
MSTRDLHRDVVRLTALVADPSGETRFVDETVPYADTSRPIHVTETAPAVSISFRWTPGDFDFNFHPSPRRRLVLVTEGALEITPSNDTARIFRAGDLMEIRDLTGRGHRSKSVGGKPFRSAFIALDDDIALDRREPLDGTPPPEAGPGVDYLHNQEDAAGRSFCAPARLPFIFGGPEGYVTPELPLTGFRFSYAAGDLDYSWHPAPRRQAVLVLSGGIAMEYGSGQRATVSAGSFLIGEDTDGQGHISRAEGGKPRFSVFAHLA